jgi:hypothetical protein
MKNIFIFAFMVISSLSLAQNRLVEIDSIGIIKPGTAEVMLDTSITNNLEAFTNKDDAIIYIYRMSSMAGAAVKWKVIVDTTLNLTIGQKQYAVAHVNSAEKSHYVAYPQMKYNYVDFKPNHYYFIRLKGFTLDTGYLDPKTFEEIKACKKVNPKANQ